MALINILDGDTLTTDAVKTAAAAAITEAGLPDAAGAQTACAAAITAADLPTSVAAAVGAQAACAAALGAMFPDLLEVTASLAAEDLEELVVGQAGKIIEVWGYDFRAALANTNVILYSGAFPTDTTIFVGGAPLYGSLSWPPGRYKRVQCLEGESLYVTNGIESAVSATIYYRIVDAP